MTPPAVLKTYFEAVGSSQTRVGRVARHPTWGRILMEESDEGSEAKKTVFVSIRIDRDELSKNTTKHVLSGLRTLILDQDLDQIDVDNLPSAKSNEYVAAANELIQKTHAAILIMTGRYFDVEKPPCHQEEEVKAILELRRRRGNYPIRILLVSKGGDPDLQEFLGVLTSDKYAHYQLHTLPVVDGCDLADPNSWINPFKKILGQLQDDLRALDNKAPLKRDVAPFESAYLSRALQSWARGLGAGGAARSSIPAFQFEAGRFIQLSATEVGDASAAPQSADIETRALPVTNWLFGDKHKALLLCGGAGAGATCTLSMAAMAYAATLNKTLATAAANLECPQEMVCAAKEIPGHVPVLLNAAQLLDGQKAGKLPTDAVCEAIAAAMQVDGGPVVTPAMIAERMQVRSYVLLVDELDRLSHTDEVEVLKQLRSLNAVSKLKHRFVACGRPPEGERVRDFTAIVLRPPTLTQRTAFLEAYAQSQTNSDEAKERLRQAARLIGKLSGSAGLFATPLLLNAFCAHALEKGFDERRRASQVRLCKLISDDLIQQLANPAQKGAASLPEDKTRAILRVLAFEALRRPVGLDRARAIVAQITGERREDAVLDLLVQQTGLIETVSGRRNETEYRGNGLFGAYFAALHVADLPQPDAVLGSVSEPEAVREWRQVIAFATSMLFSDGGEAKALGLIDAILTKAEAEQGVSQIEWFLLAAHALASLSPSFVDDGELPAQQAQLDRAASVFVRSAGKWPPARRASAIETLSTAVRRDDTRETRRTVNALMKSMLGLTEDWIKPPRFTHPSGDDDGMLIAGLPVLVAHFDEFTRHDDQAPEDVVLISNDRRGDPSAADHWLEMQLKPALPVTFVTFYEAWEYCRFLEERLRARKRIGEDECVRLPTPREWSAIVNGLLNGKKYMWGSQAPGDGELAQVNWEGAGIGRATAPGAFGSHGSSNLYDLVSNVAVWTTPDRARGERIWPPRIDSGERVDVCGAHFGSGRVRLLGAGETGSPLPTQRRRERGIRLVRTRRTMGW